MHDSPVFLDRYGVEFLGEFNGRYDLEVDGDIERYLVHHILAFDPVRRRMSVIVQNPTGKSVL